MLDDHMVRVSHNNDPTPLVSIFCYFYITVTKITDVDMELFILLMVSGVSVIMVVS
jgi:hypothetical protein